MIMTERLEEYRTIDAEVSKDDFSPQRLVDELLYGMPFTKLDQSSVRFRCWCSELRLVSALATLSRSDIEDLVRDGEVLEITCDYCGKEYRIAPANLQGLMDAS
jgi:molecular chaperone Hsp33